MRLTGQEKMGYYPTPPETLRLLTALLKPEQGGLLRLLDPCAGKGEALAAAADALKDQGGQVMTFAVELSHTRAADAAKVLDHVIQATWWDVTTRNGAYSLLWLNPPYDWEYGEIEGEKKRQRLEYQFLRATEEKLMPGGVLVYIVPRMILARSNVARFIAAHFEQVNVWQLPADEYDRFNQVVLLGVRRRKAQRDETVETALMDAGKGGLIPSLETATVTYTVPVNKIDGKSFFFRKAILSPEEGAELAVRHGVLVTNATWRDDRRIEDNGVGFRPLMPLRRGHLAMLIASGLMGVNRLGDLVVRGHAVKEEVLAEKTENKEVYREQFRTHLYVFNTRTGEFKIISDAKALEKFLEDHAIELAKIIQERHEPLYDKPTPEEWVAVSGIARNKRLPGRKETGLLDAQKHVAIAAARGIRTNGHAHIVAEMGFGKTLTALAVVEALNAWPAIVMCPPHLTEKWKREVEDGVPGAKGVILESVGDMEALARTYRPGEKVVAIVSKERAKLGSGWRHAAAVRPVLLGYRKSDRSPIYGKALACPRCGRTVEDEDELALLFPEQMGKKRKRCVCGEPLYEFNGFRRWPLARFIRDKHKGFFRLLIADEVHQYKAKSSDQGQAFQHLINATSQTLTLTGTFFGGKSTSIFWLLYRLDEKVRREFQFHDERRWASLFGRLEIRYGKKKVGANEDGTFSGTRRYRNSAKELPGISPQIVRYVLPTAIFAKVADLGYDMPDYREDVVRIPMTPTQEADYKTVHDDLLAEYKDHRFDSEAASWLSIWMQNSLARPNSAFRDEEVTRLKEKTGKQEIREVVMQLPAVVDANDPADLLPKEEWLVEECKKDAIEGRKALVYVRQTASRDIQPRLEQVLTWAGLRARILPTSLSPSKREAWIDQHVNDIDVLIVNPRKVETGLDLVAFSTAIFYEPDYSLYTLWQAMRRVWRLGQTKPVVVKYLVYQDTLEDAALALMGEKLKAAMLLYGDNANSAISGKTDDGDFLGELAKRVLAGETLSAGGLSGLLKPDTRTTTSPLGSPTQTTPPVPKRPDWTAILRQARRVNGNGRSGRRRRKQVAAPAQLSLF